MATFAELIADVIILTNRPDLVNETTLAVKAATLKIHQADYFYKDIYETGVSFASSEYSQQLEYRTLFPRFRALKYLRKSDSTGSAGSFFKVLTPAEILDEYGLAKEDICYAAGELIQIKSSTAFQYMILGCYLNPDLSTYGSWIALDHPYAIVYEAAITIFKAIGYDEQAAVFQRMAAEQLQLVRNSNILVEGY
jgi:hypothetical protein